eukprot:738934-Alexandrium_andersonii.AAC.2
MFRGTHLLVPALRFHWCLVHARQGRRLELPRSSDRPVLEPVGYLAWPPLGVNWSLWVEEDAADGALGDAQLRGQGDDAVSELQRAGDPLAARKGLNGLQRVGMDGHRLRAEAPGMVRRPA